MIEHGGLEQLSVSWPDRPAERFTQDMCDRHKIRTETVFPEFDSEEVTELGPVEFIMEDDELVSSSDETDESDSSSDESKEAPNNQSLSELDVPGLNLLLRAGLSTVGDVVDYIRENGDLTPIKGIGEKLDEEIRNYLITLE